MRKLNLSVLALLGFAIFVTPCYPFNQALTEKTIKEALVNKDWDKVIETASVWKNQDNTTSVPYLVLAYAYYVKGDYKKVSQSLDFVDSHEKKEFLLAWVEEFVREYPQNSVPYLLKGDSYIRLKKYADAVKEFDKAEELEPGFFLVYVAKGMLYAFQNNHDQAIKNFTEAIKLKPNLADVYNNRGIVYFSKDDYTSALDDFNQAIKINPEFTLAYLNRGNVYHSLGKEQLASGDFEKVAKIGFGANWTYEKNIVTNKWQVKSITPEVKFKTPILEGVSTKSEGKIIKAEEGGTVSEKALGDDFITSTPSFLLYNGQFLSKAERGN